MKTVWYLDDNNVKHFTVVRNALELLFLRQRFNYVGVFNDYQVRLKRAIDFI